MKLPHDTHVLVADGAKVLLFRNDGDATRPNLLAEAHTEHADPATRDIGTGKPGRAATGAKSGGVGGAGAHSHSAHTQTDFHQQAEDEFDAGIAKRLNALVAGGQVRRVIIVAAPKALGQIRKHLDARAEAAVAGEIAKDLAHHATDAIARAILDA